MIETVVGGAILAALSGLAFLAYNEPHLYSQLLWPLFALATAAAIGLVSWDMGTQNAYQSLAHYIALKDFAAADVVVRGSSRLVEIGIGTYIVFCLYIGFLRSLALYIMDTERHRSHADPQKDA